MGLCLFFDVLHVAVVASGRLVAEDRQLDVRHDPVECVGHEHAGMVLLHDDSRPSSVRVFEQSDVVLCVVERVLCVDGTYVMELAVSEQLPAFLGEGFFLFLHLDREVVGFLFVVHHHLEQNDVAGVGRRRVGVVLDGRHLGGWLHLWGTRKNEK
ncbi:MAG: hypothetical protein [Cressdnaviricota sp.]|nr:MAG: hypothetical protein [Cressdnaviricota sp.]